MDAHPLAATLPPMSKQEFEDLVGDIAEHGLREEIITLDGMVLDGRHRLKACEEAGVEPRFRKFKGDSPAGFVLSVNLHRRHLSASQRGVVAKALLPQLQREAAARKAAHMREGERDEKGRVQSAPKGADWEERRAAAEAARLVGVSTRTVQRADRVATADPALAEKVLEGAVSLGQAERRLQVVEAVEPLGEEAQQQAREGASAEEILEAASASNPEVARRMAETRDARLDHLLSVWISESNPVAIAKEATLDFLGRTSRRKAEARLRRLRDMEALARELADHIESHLTMPLREAK